ncbi:MAG: hypothetical protein WCA81_16360 [Rhizomicrobium sp.]
MIQNLQRTVFPTLAVTGVYLFYLVVLAGFIEFELILVETGKAKDYQHVSLIAFAGYELLVLSGILPSSILHRLKIRRLSAYLLAGATAGVLLFYSQLFAFFVGGHLAPFSVAYGMREYNEAPGLSVIFRQVFLRLPSIGKDMIGLGGRSTALACLIGLFFSGLYWLIVVRRSVPRT